MTVQDLILKLMGMPRTLEITLDIDDGLSENFVPILGVTERHTVMGNFVSIDADISRIGVKK